MAATPVREDGCSTHSAQLPLLIFCHPSRIARRKLDVVFLGVLGDAVGMQLHVVWLIRDDEAGACCREQHRKQRCAGHLHCCKREGSVWKSESVGVDGTMDEGEESGADY